MAHLEWEITKRRMAGVTDAGVTPVASTRRRRPWWSTAARPGSRCSPSPDRPTAVACQSDLLASGVVLAARELGLRVPQDVSVSGFDGLDLPWLGPDVLTTVVQPLAEKGAAIGHAVEDLLAGEPPSYARAARGAADRHDHGTRTDGLSASAYRPDDRLGLAQHPRAVDAHGQVDARGPGLGVERSDDGDDLDRRGAGVGHRARDA